MEGNNPNINCRTSFGFLLLILLQLSAEALDICSAPITVNIQENNPENAVLVDITVQLGVTVALNPPTNDMFKIEGNQLIATKALDYEAAISHTVKLICTDPATSSMFPIVIVVIVDNVNDNPPVFNPNFYRINVTEMSPVGTSVGRFPATDKDGGSLYYTLTSESGLNAFKLLSVNNPVILVETLLDYDTVKNVSLLLTVQDTPLFPPSSTASNTATATIMVDILDLDNRPPWFQPCEKYEMGPAVICQGEGYTGRVNLNEEEPGVLPLKPGPIYAIDGDSGIDDEITYSLLGGDGDGLFQIDPNTGNITMLKPADLLGTISLTVSAAQKSNSFQVATTTVKFIVQVKSLHPPTFQFPLYEGVITGVGVMATDQKNKDEPLNILATDDDYAATGGLNPHITYTVNGSSDFSIINGRLFLTKDLPESTLTLQVVATDTATDETATAELTVEVKSGPNTTTSSPPITTSSGITPGVTESKTTGAIAPPTKPSTSSIIPTTNPRTSTDIIVTATKPSTSTDIIVTATKPSGVSTDSPSLTTGGSVSTASTAHPVTVIVPSGGYGSADMAAIGATLGVLLFICLVVIGLLLFRNHKGKADWSKLYETSVFRSSLGQGSGGQKKGIQYTNEAFQNDEDGGSIGSGGPKGGSVKAVPGPAKAAADSPTYEVVNAKSAVALNALLPDDASQTGSDQAENEKVVKPILTKERRMDEGYKSVWFKEHIDPDAMEEVVIIPDSREHDSEEEEDEDDKRGSKRPKVGFQDTDLDSGLGVKIDDPAEDSEGDETLNVDL